MSASTAVGEAVRRLTTLAPELAMTDDDLITSWAPDDPPVTLRFAGLADSMIEAAGQLRLEQVTAIFDTVEELLTSASEPVPTAVATGFLESIMAATARGEIDVATVAEFLGPESLAYCEAWEAFVQGESPG